MSLMLFGSSEPELTPEEPARGSRRRYLIVLATVIAVILGGGSAAFLLLNSGPNVDRAAPNTYTPPTDATSTGSPDLPAASVSPSASPSHSPSPSRSPSARPSSSGGTAPVVFRVSPDHLCPSVDFAPVQQVAGSPSTAPYVDNHTDKSNYVDYHCEGTYGKVKAFVDAMIFADAGSASAIYTSTKAADQSTITGVEQLSGIGTDAYGYIASTRYVVWATQGNLVLKIYVNATGGVPPPGQLRDPAIASARGTIPRLRA
jgi:hypothetical protein